MGEEKSDVSVEAAQTAVEANKGPQEGLKKEFVKAAKIGREWFRLG